MKIMQGTFAGMDFKVPDFNTAMLLGTWELELRETLQEILSINPSGVICIGAAEGYYAIGMAIKFPHINVLAYEDQSKYRHFLSNLAKDNEVKNLVSRGKCMPSDIQTSIRESGERALIICGVEGFEEKLLDPSKSHELEKAFILVEVHEMYVHACEEMLVGRFQDTHRIKTICGRDRLISDFPRKLSFLKLLSTKTALLNLMNEGRPFPMNWLWMVPKGLE